MDLSGVRYLVLDEVDSLLQMGFEQQVRRAGQHVVGVPPVRGRTSGIAAIQ